jgi:hypothetical protein
MGYDGGQVIQEIKCKRIVQMEFSQKDPKLVVLLLSDAHYSSVLVISLENEKKNSMRAGAMQGSAGNKKESQVPEFSPLVLVSQPSHPTLVPFHPPLSKVTFNPFDQEYLCTTGDDLF